MSEPNAFALLEKNAFLSNLNKSLDDGSLSKSINSGVDSVRSGISRYTDPIEASTNRMRQGISQVDKANRGLLSGAMYSPFKAIGSGVKGSITGAIDNGLGGFVSGGIKGVRDSVRNSQATAAQNMQNIRQGTRDYLTASQNLPRNILGMGNMQTPTAQPAAAQPAAAPQTTHRRGAGQRQTQPPTGAGSTVPAAQRVAQRGSTPSQGSLPSLSSMARAVPPAIAATVAPAAGPATGAALNAAAANPAAAGRAALPMVGSAVQAATGPTSSGAPVAAAANPQGALSALALPPTQVAQPASASPPAAHDTGGVDWDAEFRKYHGGGFNPNSADDQQLMQQMQEIYRQQGALDPNSVYSRQYGRDDWWNKSAFAQLGEMEKGASILGKGLRAVGGALTRSGRGAQKVYKTNFQNYYKGLDKAQRAAASPALRQRASQIWSTKADDLGKTMGIGRARVGTGGWMNNAANRLDEFALLNPGMNRFANMTTLGGVGLGSVGASNAAYGRFFAPPTSSGGRTVMDSDAVEKSAFAQLGMEKEASSLVSHGLKRLGGLIGRSGWNARRLAREGADDVSKLPEGIGGLRSDWGQRLRQAGKRIDNSPGLARGIDAGVLGGGALAANRLGHGSGRRSGVADGFDTGTSFGIQTAMANQPQAGNFFQRLGGLFTGGPQGPSAEALEAAIMNQRPEILRQILNA